MLVDEVLFVIKNGKVPSYSKVVMSEKQLYGTQLKLQNVFCIGRNYSEHAKELNNPIPTTPVVFIKPTSSVCYDGESIIIPRQSKNVHHQIEVVVVIGRNGKMSSIVELARMSFLKISFKFIP